MHNTILNGIMAKASDEHLDWSTLQSIVNHSVGHCKLKYTSNIYILNFFSLFLDLHINNIIDYSLVINQAALTTVYNSNTISQTKHDQ